MKSFQISFFHCYIISITTTQTLCNSTEMTGTPITLLLSRDHHMDFVIRDKKEQKKRTKKEDERRRGVPLH